MAVPEGPAYVGRHAVLRNRLRSNALFPARRSLPFFVPHRTFPPGEATTIVTVGYVDGLAPETP